MKAQRENEKGTIWKNESATKREKKCDNKTRRIVKNYSNCKKKNLLYSQKTTAFRKNMFYLFVILYKLSQSKNWDTLCTFTTFYLKEPYVYNFFYKI